MRSSWLECSTTNHLSRCVHPDVLPELKASEETLVFLREEGVEGARMLTTCASSPCDDGPGTEVDSAE